MKKYIIIFSLVSQMFAIGGIGIYGASEIFSYPSSTDEASSGLYRFQSDSFNNSTGGGFFIYTDLLPFIDLEYSGEFNLQTHQIRLDVIDPVNEEFSVGEKTDFGWFKTSHYFTVRREVFGASVPFLAKASINLGLGLNTHNVMQSLTPNLIETALGDANLLDASGFTLSQKDTDKIVTYIIENRKKYSGFHLQAGAHGKLLIFNVFINARYTIAKDVIKGTNGFPSLWAGLALGF